MDWTKAKTILIVALLITNLFLIVTYGLDENVNGESVDEQMLIDILAGKNIFLELEVPKKHKNMKILSVEFSATDMEKAMALLEKEPEISQGASEEEYKAVAEGFIKNAGYMTENVVFDSIEQEQKQKETGEAVMQTVVQYKNVHGEITVEESYMRCIYLDGKLMDFKRYWLTPKSLGKERLRTISASSALITFMSDTTWDEPIYIRDIQLVYWLADAGYNIETALSDMAFPAWKITYNDGRVKHIPAVEF